MKKVLLFVAIAIVSFTEVFAQENKEKEFEKFLAASQEGVYNTQYIDIPYRYFKFNTGKGEAPMLVVYLHDSKGNGQLNREQMHQYGLRMVYDYLQRHNQNAILVVPQCRKDRYWYENYTTLGETMNKLMYRFINDFIKERCIDVNRVYIMGSSSGGTGVWNIVSKYPKLFAAAMPVAAIAYRKYLSASSVARTPLCFVVCNDPQWVAKEKLIEMNTFIDLLKKNGCKMNCTYLMDNLYNVINTSFSDDRLDWVFSQSKGNLPQENKSKNRRRVRLP
ncbi:MAG: prolyl oligopeptidase family serine peptidase [Alistipes sp.]|nr:prolyl oligopeptidase family serine peptidase [Candidatus Alistipes equi]